MTRAEDSAAYSNLSTMPDDDDEPEDFHLPIHAPPPPVNGHAHTPSGSSILSFADFVSAPGRTRRQKSALKSSKLNPANGKAIIADNTDDTDEVLFDEHETMNGGFDSASASGSGGKDSADEESNATSSNDSRLGKGAGPRRTSKARAS